MTVFALTYEKPSAPVPALFQGIPDPRPLEKRPSQALVELAHSCGVQAYTLDSADEGSLDMNPQAVLYIHPAQLSSAAFDCLANQVRPPYLTLSKVERCRRLMERRSDDPPCPVVVY